MNNCQYGVVAELKRRRTDTNSDLFYRRESDKKRQQQDSNLQGQSPVAFEATAIPDYAMLA